LIDALSQNPPEVSTKIRVKWEISPTSLTYANQVRHRVQNVLCQVIVKKRTCSESKVLDMLWVDTCPSLHIELTYPMGHSRVHVYNRRVHIE